ncbi:helix-turn-helix domain-containing protein [Catellicoccus marimammalium]|uniref:HTH cro/C1-type domain-containing protein n=1 Tax=Catellicoccus marimammalium M35/04/3 TaxID=1234409 RepID=K8ZAZ9_9ENTE|nr:helix-turn-helix transcriptional regulator [Catellicoccus marimammalium]EKU27217.1 hypothetical protein C683_0874 [Catellicoccus marimammalium M35/04/3]
MSQKSELSAFLKQLRVEKKLSQKELAKKLDIACPRVSNLETSAIYPSDKFLKKYSDFFNVPMEKLVKLAEPDREKFRLKEIRTKINNYYQEIREIYDNSNYKEDLVSIIQDIVNSDKIIKSIPENYWQQQNLLIPYFPNVKAFQKFSLGIKSDGESIAEYINPKNYSNPDKIVVINTSTSLKSMNRIFPEHTNLFIELDAKLKIGDIVFYLLDDEYSLARLGKIEGDNGHTIPILHFESLDLNYSKDIPLTKSILNNITFIGKVVGMRGSDKLLNL